MAKQSGKTTMSTISMLSQLLPTLLDGASSKHTGLRSRFERIDAYLEKESDKSSDTQKGRIVNELGDKSKIGNTEIAICKIQKETAHAYLTGLFLTGSPIFAAVADKELENAASMLTALTARDQERLAWIPNMMEAFSDVLKYNICAVEVGWTQRRGTAVAESLGSTGKAKLGVANPIVYEGNGIKHLDPYNLILDRSVNPSKIHTDGTYGGYVERINYIQLKRRYLEWNDLFTIKANIAQIWTSAPVGDYYEPTYHRSNDGRKDNTWADFWGNATLSRKADVSGAYEVTTLYARLIPREFEIAATNAGQPQIFKLIYVNRLLAYSELLSQSHEYLPIVVGQLDPGTLDTKSYCEYVTDLQDLSTSLMTAALNSQRRAVSDRAIYDQSRISKAAVESTSPVAKIPVKTNAYQQGIEGAYKSIPYEDHISGNLTGMISLIDKLAERTTGQNPVSQGTFQKGNKTTTEFTTTMSNSDARMQLRAMFIDGHFIAPIKEILKFNYFLNATSETVRNKAEQKNVQIDPVVLRSLAPEFQMADGIMPATKLANTEVMVQAITFMRQDPMLSMEYNTSDMIVSVLKQQGLTGLSSYKRTEDEKQQYIQQQAALMQAQQPQPTQQQGAQ